jgi:hypothetical protein
MIRFILASAILLAPATAMAQTHLCELDHVTAAGPSLWVFFASSANNEKLIDVVRADGTSVTYDLKTANSAVPMGMHDSGGFGAAMPDIGQSCTFRVETEHGHLGLKLSAFMLSRDQTFRIDKKTGQLVDGGEKIGKRIDTEFIAAGD